MDSGTAQGSKQFKVEMDEGLHRIVDEYRIARGLPMGEVLALAIEAHLQEQEAQPWAGYGLVKAAGAPWPARPSTASNRRGGPGSIARPAKATTARMSASVWERWVAYLYWTRAHNRLESEAAARTWLATQGVDVGEL